MWVDNEGRLLKGLMPMGITVVRSDRNEIARDLKAVRGLPDLATLTSVPLEGSIPGSQALKFLRLKVESDRQRSLPSDGFRQSYRNSEIVLNREVLPTATYRLPCTDPKMEKHLMSSRFIRSDDSVIRRQAEEILGDEKDPIRAARLINAWVHNNLKKVPTAVVPDAVTVLTNKQGACNEHSVLAAALARAVGLPAQVVVGLVYSGDGFYYHAWVTYWAGDRWFTGDPLMNLVPVDPTHIALLYGDVDKQVNVISFLGQLKLKVLEAN
jgi:transglutaminase-like putative cysteine protease